MPSLGHLRPPEGSNPSFRHQRWVFLMDHIVQTKGGTFWPNERIAVPPLKGTGERLPVVVDKLNMSPYSACKARTALKDNVKLIKACTTIKTKS